MAGDEQQDGAAPDMSGASKRLDGAIGHVVAGGAMLALPVAFLLFLQWPLRDLFRGWSREANDLGQIAFALYVAIAVTAATRAGSHLALATSARTPSSAARRRWRRATILLGALPWSLFLIVSGRQLFWAALSQGERFADTANPGYFLVKLAAALLALLLLLQAILDWRNADLQTGRRI